MKTVCFGRSESENVWLYCFCSWKPMKTTGFKRSKSEKAWLFCFCGWKLMKTLGFGRSKSEQGWLYCVCVWKPMKTLGFGRSKSTTLRFWTHQDQQSCAGTWFAGSRIAPGPTNLCWYRYGGTRASKPVLVHTTSKVTFLEKVKWGPEYQGEL